MNISYTEYVTNKTVLERVTRLNFGVVFTPVRSVTLVTNASSGKQAPPRFSTKMLQHELTLLFSLL